MNCCPAENVRRPMITNSFSGPVEPHGRRSAGSGSDSTPRCRRCSRARRSPGGPGERNPRARTPGSIARGWRAVRRGRPPHAHVHGGSGGMVPSASPSWAAPPPGRRGLAHRGARAHQWHGAIAMLLGHTSRRSHEHRVNARPGALQHQGQALDVVRERPQPMSSSGTINSSGPSARPTTRSRRGTMVATRWSQPSALTRPAPAFAPTRSARGRRSAPRTTVLEGIELERVKAHAEHGIQLDGGVRIAEQRHELHHTTSA